MIVFQKCGYFIWINSFNDIVGENNIDPVPIVLGAFGCNTDFISKRILSGLSRIILDSKTTSRSLTGNGELID